MCAPGPSAPIASARGGAEDAGPHTAGTQGAGQHRKPQRAGMAGIPQAGDRRQRCRRDPRHFSVSHCPRPVRRQAEHRLGCR